MGAGLIGARHVERVLAHPKATLVGVVDPQVTPAEDIAHFSAIDDVDCPVDGVIIATPTALHAAHGAQAAKQGWHILMEKPVTQTPVEAEQLAKAVATANIACLVGHHRRYHPAVQRLRDMVRGGDIGTPITSTLIWAMRKPDSYFDTNWRQTDGSPVMINLVHDIDLLRFVLGEVREITALGTNHIRAANRTESGGAVLRFDSGAIATISFADTAPSPWGFEAGMGENPNIATTGQDMWWITGTKGGIAFPSLTRWGGAADWSQPAQPAATPVPTAIPLDAQLDHFIDVIAGRASPIIDIPDAAASLTVTRQLEDMLAPSAQPPHTATPQSGEHR